MHIGIVISRHNDKNSGRYAGSPLVPRVIELWIQPQLITVPSLFSPIMPNPLNFYHCALKSQFQCACVVDPPAVVGISPNHSSFFKSQPNWMKYISLERKNSDLQDGATRFVILLLVVCKIKLYTMGKENLDPQVFMCNNLIN